jgi:hypothetical protein
MGNVERRRHLVHLLADRGEHDDLDALGDRVLLEGPRHLPAGLVRHHDVEDHELRPAAPRLRPDRQSRNLGRMASLLRQQQLDQIVFRQRGEGITIHRILESTHTPLVKQNLGHQLRQPAKPAPLTPNPESCGPR